MIFSNKVYDRLKFLAQILLPALATFYLAFGQMWGLPETEKVAGTIVLIDTLLGAILQISSSQMTKLRKIASVEGGYLTQTGADPDTGIPSLGLTVTTDPSELMKAKEVRFKVGSAPPRIEGELPNDGLPPEQL